MAENLTPQGLIARQLRGLRELARSTQKEVAEAMNAAGFPSWVPVTVREVERDRRYVSLEELLALAAIFEVPAVSFLLPVGDERLEMPHASLDGYETRELLLGRRGKAPGAASWPLAGRVARGDEKWSPAPLARRVRLGQVEREDALRRGEPVDTRELASL